MTGIIDGTGTMGTAVGQFIVGTTSTSYGWQNGYWLVIAIDISVTFIPIIRIVYEEFKELRMIKTSVKAMGLNNPALQTPMTEFEHTRDSRVQMYNHK